MGWWSMVEERKEKLMKRRVVVGYGIVDGRVVFPLIWPQAVGCAIMGTALARKTELIELYVLPRSLFTLSLRLSLNLVAFDWVRYPPLYLFFTTGTSPLRPSQI